MINLLRILCFCLFSISLSNCGSFRVAPYFMPLDNNPPDVNEVIKATGVKHFTLAFILAPDKGGCVPTWDGNTTRKVLTTNSMVDCVINSLSIIEIINFLLSKKFFF